MSASLVGSEMCIRDSWRSPRPLKQSPLTSDCHLARTSRAPTQRAQALSCLLYTSDAADDM
eukprot:14628917-Alexandrium_andersonii.AAC.1